MSLKFPEVNSLGIPTKNDPLSDFRKFLFLVWRHLNLPDPTPVQYDIAYQLQHGPKRLIIEAFRGVGKSWVTSAYVCWLLYMNPQLNILVVSASKVRADDFTTFTLRLIKEMDILKHLTPRAEQRDSKVAFDVGPARASHAPSVKSVGITGQLAGSRADVIIPDDVEVPNNSLTQTMRDKLSEAIKEFDAVLKPEGIIRYLGTPQTEMSIYNLLSERGYTTIIWPARYPDKKRLDSYGDKLSLMIATKLNKNSSLEGLPTDPQRFSDYDLQEREASYGRSGFALQFMLDTTLSDADRYPLKVSDLVVMDVNSEVGPEKVVWASSPEQHINSGLPNVAFQGDKFYRPLKLVGDFIPYSGSVMAIDPSGRGTDETGFAVVKFLNGQFFVTAAGGLRGGYNNDVLKKLADVAKSEQVNEIIIESNFGDGMFAQLLKPVLAANGYPVTCTDVRHNIMKERRIIDTLEPVMNSHKLIINQKIIIDDYKANSDLPLEQSLRYQLIYQLTRITNVKGALVHDDRLDALAMAVNYWVEQASADTDRMIKERQDELFDKERQDFLDLVNSGLSNPYKGCATVLALPNGKSYDDTNNSDNLAMW